MLRWIARRVGLVDRAEAHDPEVERIQEESAHARLVAGERIQAAGIAREFSYSDRVILGLAPDRRTRARTRA